MKITANSRNQMRNNAANSRRDVLRYIGTGLTTSAMSLFLGAKTAHSAIPRIGFLSVPPSGDSPVFDAFQKGMHDLGYKPGSNISIEWLCAEGKETELPKLATDLVNARV